MSECTASGRFFLHHAPLIDWRSMMYLVRLPPVPAHSISDLRTVLRAMNAWGNIELAVIDDADTEDSETVRAALRNMTGGMNMAAGEMTDTIGNALFDMSQWVIVKG